MKKMDMDCQRFQSVIEDRSGLGDLVSCRYSILN